MTEEIELPLCSTADTGELAAALAAAQAQFPAIVKDRVASIPTKSGSTYRFKYADLADVLAAVRPVLAAHGLSVMQMIHRRFLVTALLHTSGQRVVSCADLMELPSDWKAYGAAATYLRRYSLSAMLGIAADDDADAPDTPRAESDPQKVRAPAARSAMPAEKSESKPATEGDSGELATDGERAFLKKRAGDGLDDLLKRIGASSLEALTAEQFKAARSELVRAA